MCHLDHHRKFLTKIIVCVILDSDVAGSSKDNQRIQSTPKTQLSRKVRPVGGQESTQEIEKRTVFDHDDGTDSTRTRRPVCGSESAKRCVLTPTHVEEDQTSTGRPALVDQKEEHEIDFRVLGLSHAFVKEAEHLRVQELVKRSKVILIEKHFQPTCSRITSYNPFSNNSKAMIRESGNVELSELCETIPKVQCSHCLLYWNQGIVYCTCGQCLIDIESRRKFNKLRLVALSIPHYVIKKGPDHGARHGKTKEQTEYHTAWNAWKRCCILQVFTIAFSETKSYRESQLLFGWTEQKCIKIDELAKQNHTYHLSTEEFKRIPRTMVSHLEQVRQE